MLKLTKRHARKVLQVVDAGLCGGVGKPIPGQMCVEAAVCFALGEPHGDNPTCVDPTLRSFKISLNDKNWSSNEARAKGLRRIAIAQLGTRGNFDSKLFAKKLAEMTIRKTVPQTIRLVAEKAPNPHKENMLTIALKCEQEGTEGAAREANKVVRAYYAAADAAAAYAAAAAAAAAYAAAADAAAAYAAYAAADAAAAAAAAAAADAAADAARDKVLAEYAENVVQILIEMKTPGSKWLDITKS